VGLRAVLDAVVKRKIPSPRRESNPRTLTFQPELTPINDNKQAHALNAHLKENFLTANPIKMFAHLNWKLFIYNELELTELV
jgi:hypothetical protein